MTQHSESIMKDMQTLSQQRISLSRQGKLEVEVIVVTSKTTIVVKPEEIQIS